MDLWRSRRLGAATAALVLCLWVVSPAAVAAQQWDPTAAVAAYSAALNHHDVSAALALFDQYGSATDAAGHHFEGRAGLTEFLLNSGFRSSDARITTEALRVIGNRAVWTYSCSCGAGSTEVRMVMAKDKISVFAIMEPRTLPQARPNAGVIPWLIGLGLLAGAFAGWLGWRTAHPAVVARQGAQGRLLAALLQSRSQQPGRTTVGDAQSLGPRRTEIDDVSKGRRTGPAHLHTRVIQDAAETVQKPAAAFISHAD